MLSTQSNVKSFAGNNQENQVQTEIIRRRKMREEGEETEEREETEETEEREK